MNIEKLNNCAELAVQDSQHYFPNIIGVGAPRCATSLLYEFLMVHPLVYMSPTKEINYFGLRELSTDEANLTFEQYLSYFDGAIDQPLRGEISPIYLSQ